MKYLKIQNDVLLDIRLVALMGGTTKFNDKYKIGQFGTGLKYTLAYLFRNNIDFKIFSGREPISITTEKEEIQNTTFEIISINGQRSGMTTQMGMQWNAWMIIRELWCNALDEGGEHKSVIERELLEKLEGEDGKTTFYIQMLPEIQQVMDDWGAYFIHHLSPIWESDEYAIYVNESNKPLKVYKKGVLIYQHPNTHSLFYYDIKGAEINELREFKGSLSYEIFHALNNPNHETVSYFLNNIKEDHYEGSEMDFHWFTSFADIWKDTIGNNRISKIGDRSYYADQGAEVDFSNVIELPKKVYTALVNDFTGIGALVMTDDKSEFFEIPSPDLQNRIAGVLAFLSNSGYEIKSDINIRIGMFRENNKKSSANRNKKSIMISEVCNKLSDEKIAALLIENNEYIKTGFEKDSTDYFRHFVNLYTMQLLASNAVEV